MEIALGKSGNGNRLFALRGEVALKHLIVFSWRGCFSYASKPTIADRNLFTVCFFYENIFHLMTVSLALPAVTVCFFYENIFHLMTVSLASN
jgi:hypothetical protein